ncbi:MAG: DNA-protecting protein DprA [Burkholderiales bacterium]|nr:DNA-protecting protein DprA [Burkholderiales bacterium]
MTLASEASAEDELASWLRLQLTEGVGAQTARKLLGTFGLPKNIFDASISLMRGIVPERVAQALSTPLPDEQRDLISRSLAWANQAGNRILTLADADYPPSLLDISDPPLLLYVKGRLELLERPMLAVVGSRNATTQGMTNAEKFSHTLSEAGLTIVSGLALGIDTAAHQGALNAVLNGGSTVAVIGTGSDIVYPARNRNLAHRIAEEGCIVSEYPLGTPAISSNFPRRNRIISGLARGVLVVEAAAQSGSLITARMAADQGRDVFAIPGSIHSPLAKGCHQLIKQGAKLVESAQDILEELAFHPITARSELPSSELLNQVDEPTSELLQAMGFDPIHFDELIQRSSVDPGSLHTALLQLELEGKIERLPGELYRRLG